MVLWKNEKNIRRKEGIYYRRRNWQQSVLLSEYSAGCLPTYLRKGLFKVWI